MNRSATLYDQIGHGYQTHRSADVRIVQKLVDLISAPPGAVICDVGAGSGNYATALAERGYSILAIDPSEVMRAQAAPSDKVIWFDGVAERLPLPDNCATATICIFAAHHFTSLLDAACEMQRVCPNGPLVFFTFDPREGEHFWISDYFPEIVSAGRKVFPPLLDFVAEIERLSGRLGEVHNFLLPRDLTDRFLHAPWSQPEVYFDPMFRNNNSGFAKAPPESVERGLELLRADLSSGVWEARYGSLLNREYFDGGYRFVIFRTENCGKQSHNHEA